MRACVGPDTSGLCRTEVGGRGAFVLNHPGFGISGCGGTLLYALIGFLYFIESHGNITRGLIVMHLVAFMCMYSY